MYGNIVTVFIKLLCEKYLSWFYNWFIFNMSDTGGAHYFCQLHGSDMLARYEFKHKKVLMKMHEWFIKATKYLAFNSLPGFTNVLAVEDLMTTSFLFNRRFVEMIILYLEFCEVSNELLKKTRPKPSRIFIIYFWNRLNSVVR